MTEEQRQLAEAKTIEILASNTVITAETRESLDSTFGAIKTFLDDNKTVKPASATEATALFGQYKELLKVHASALKAAKYMIVLTLDEFNFIEKVLTKKLTYNRQDVFIAKRVQDNFLSLVQYPPKSKGDTVEVFGIDIDTLTLLSYLVGKYEHVGLDKTTDLFASVVENMGNISRVFEHYNKQAEAINERAHNWIAGLEEEEETPKQAETAE
jgi:hypothetical protein